MTFLDMIEMYNAIHDKPLDDLGSMFEDIVLDERLDKNTLVNTLVSYCGAMDCIYETTATFKYFSNNFFKQYEWNISKLANTMNFEYNPIQNNHVEWKETTEIEQNLDTDESAEENRQKANTGTQGNQYENHEVNTISAMNSNNYEPDNKSDTTGGNTRTDNLRENITATNDKNKNENLTWDETDKHIEDGTVNIPYQDLIEKERKVSQFNIYNWIAEKYSKELFILVY